MSKETTTTSKIQFQLVFIIKVVHVKQQYSSRENKNVTNLLKLPMILLFPQLSNNIYFCQFLEEQGGGGGCSSITQGHLVIWVHFFSCDETSFQARKNTIYLKCVVVFILLYFNKNLDSSHSHTKSIIKLLLYNNTTIFFTKLLDFAFYAFYS